MEEISQIYEMDKKYSIKLFLVLKTIFKHKSSKTQETVI